MEEHLKSNTSQFNIDNFLSIGEGLQNKVYEYDSSSVIKSPLERSYIANKLTESHPDYFTTEKSAYPSAIYYTDTRDICINLIAENPHLQIFCNSRVLRNTYIVQDKVEPLNKIIDKQETSSSTSFLLELLHATVEIHYKVWSLGTGELTFGLDKYGLDLNGRVAIYDPFEMSNNPDDIEYLIGIKWWDRTNRQWPQWIRNHINQIFNKYLNIDTFKTKFQPQDPFTQKSVSHIEPIKVWLKKNNLS